MGKVNVCFKLVFILFNALFHVFGWLLIIGAVNPGSAWMPDGQIPIFFGVVIIGIICISVLGMYGGCTENALTLKIFAGCMGVGMVVMLIFGIIVQSDKYRHNSHTMDQMSQTVTGVLFGLFALAVVSLGMSSIMIYEITS